MKKGLDYHDISVVVDDYNTYTSLLTNLDKEQIVFMANMTPHGGIRLGK